MTFIATPSPEVQAAIERIAAMTPTEFHAVAVAAGLIAKQKEAVRPYRQRTALVKVVPKGETFTATCGWCGWATRKALTFHAAQLAAHNHNRHAHRDHCVVEARVA